MTGGEPREEPPLSAAPKQDPETLVLRARPRPVVRFRRGLIIGLAGMVAASLVALAWVSLDPPSFRLTVSDEAGGPFRKPPTEALSGAPATYADVPRLGPPLPGDLGRPLLDHQRSIAGDPVAIGTLPALDAQQAEAERQRAEAAEQAARSAGVLVPLRGAALETPSPPANGALADDRPGLPVPDASGSAGQLRKIAFARAAEGDLEPRGIEDPPSPWTLAAGTMIPASLVTGLNSDLPGLVIAQVTEPVRDSATGQTVLIPQGARLLGTYDSVVAYGQRRALLVWQRILFPNGASVRLDHVPATDSAGYAGLEGEVDGHGWQLLKGVVLSTLLGVGTELSLGSSESELVRAVRESAQQNAAHAGDGIISRTLDVQPTLKVRPGWPVRAILNKDLVLAPWKG